MSGETAPPGLFLLGSCLSFSTSSKAFWGAEDAATFGMSSEAVPWQSYPGSQRGPGKGAILSSKLGKGWDVQSFSWERNALPWYKLVLI